MESIKIKNEIDNYNALLNKSNNEEFEYIKMRIWDIICATPDVKILHQTNKSREQIKNIILDGISTI